MILILIFLNYYSSLNLSSTFRLTDLGSMTPTLNTTSFRKRTSSTPSGDLIYPIPTPYYSKYDIPQSVVEESTPPDSQSSSPLPQLTPGDHLLIPSGPSEFIKANTPEPERKTFLISIKKNIKTKSKDIMKMVYAPHESSSTDEMDNAQKTIETPEDIVNSLDGSAKFWIGKDYVNFIVKDFINLESPFDDFIDRVTTPRMPWHDVGVCIQNATAKDVARHFIQRWNATKLEKAKLNNSYPYLLPKSYVDCSNKTLSSLDETHKVTCQVNLSILKDFS